MKLGPVAVMSKIKSLKLSADHSLAKVRSKKWSKPLGQTLEVTADVMIVIGKIAPTLNYVLPMAPGVGSLAGAILCIVGSVFKVGSLLLNPKTTKKDMQKEMNEMKQKLESIKGTDKELKGSLEEDLREQIKEMEKKVKSHYAISTF